jgi:hypothetical protein
MENIALVIVKELISNKKVVCLLKKKKIKIS